MPKIKQTIATAKDFRVERMRGSGPGGQHRNKTESAIRITHIETGMSEYCCEDRSQHRNLKIAFRRLARRLLVRLETDKQRYAAGNERVRTYHEPDDRVTDHRTSQKWSYKQTVGRGEIGSIIDESAARARISAALEAKAPETTGESDG